MFESCLTLPQNPYEARLIADNFEAVARALREWPVDAWLKLARSSNPEGARRSGLFERLVARVAPLAVRPRQREQAIASAEATAAVLRCLWPAASYTTAQGEATRHAADPVGTGRARDS
jgi:hypothetical protein